MNSTKHSTPTQVSKGMWSWAMFDWANSAFFVIIQTFVFAAYFQRSIAADAITGTEQWGNMVCFQCLDYQRYLTSAQNNRNNV